MLKMKSVAAALVLVASAADVAVPVLVAPALVFGVSTAARAETPDVHQQIVRYDDLNLAAPGGKATLQARLNSAVQAVCGPQADPRRFDETANRQACVAKAMHDATRSTSRGG